MSGNISGIVQHFVFKTWINESLVFIERGSDLARAINREMVPQGLGTCCFRGSQAQTTAWNVLTEMESKGSQGEEGGKDLRENGMYKVETDMQKNKWGEEQRNIIKLDVFDLWKNSEWK